MQPFFSHFVSMVALARFGKNVGITSLISCRLSCISKTYIQFLPSLKSKMVCLRIYLGQNITIE